MLRWIIVLVMASAGCVGQVADNAEIDESSEEVLGSAWYIRLRNDYTGKCMDAPAPHRPGSRVNQYDCHSGTNQQFHLIHLSRWNGSLLVHVGSGLCVYGLGRDLRLGYCDLSQGNMLVQSFDPILVWTTGSTGYELTTVAAPDSCIDVPNGSRQNGVSLQMYQCHGGMNQRWRRY